MYSTYNGLMRIELKNITEEENEERREEAENYLQNELCMFSCLRATDWKYQKSHDRQEISDFILFHLNVPFGELFSKITIKSSTALSFF